MAGAVSVAGLVAGVLMPLSPVAAAADASVLGTSADTAAGSCWEIKQVRPTAASGAYWLLTPTMLEPQQFYCDMTTDGGGWVLVGKGRDGWTNEYQGKGADSLLRQPGLSPMSSTTAQYPSWTVNALLGGGRVDGLAEGVRLRRATNAAGTSWQEVRFRMQNRDRWVWTFGAEFALGGYSFDSSSGSGGQTATFGLDNSFRRVNNTPTSAQKYRQGFAFGSGVAGTNSATTYLWSATNGGGGALPYTEVYLRPRVLSTDPGFTAIPDAGLGEVRRPAVARNNALDSPWGVAGLAGSTAVEGSVEVQAFTQSGDRMYVGGNFAYVQRDGAGTDRVSQPFLAAFDVGTGEWDPGFRPVLDEQVRALATLPGGAVVAGGDFTQANGAPATAVVALDPATGQTLPGWRLTLENRVTGAPLHVETLAVSGSELFIGGELTHLSGGTRPNTVLYARNLAKVSAVDYTPIAWNPGLNGGVIDVDVSADGSLVYAAGHFTTSKGLPALNAVALQNVEGAPLATPAWAPVWSAAKSYQQAVQVVGDRVYVGGSEHDLFGFSTTTFARLSGNILKKNGDIQTITHDDGPVLYAGCHCNNFNYSNAFTWPTLSSGWTQADAINWFGAWDAATGAVIPEFTPSMRMRLGSGVWALQTDSTGVLWAGGDIDAVRTSTKAQRWSGGFARFAPADSQPPSTPTGLRVVSSTATDVKLAWDSAGGSSVHYVVLRDDRPIASTDGTSLTVPRGGSDRFFVRAVDTAGNGSATSAVIVAPPPPPPSDLTEVTAVARGASWRWYYQSVAPAAGWQQGTYDDSGWATGNAVLGFGTSVATDIDSYATTAERPKTAYFRTTFQVADASKVARLVVDTVGDDGIVVYVNGVEVARQNMPTGAVTFSTSASSARRSAVANASPLVVEVPVELLVGGTNTLAAETHLNYRGTADVSFDLDATLFVSP